MFNFDFSPLANLSDFFKNNFNGNPVANIGAVQPNNDLERQKLLLQMLTQQNQQSAPAMPTTQPMMANMRPSTPVAMPQVNLTAAQPGQPSTMPMMPAPQVGMLPTRFNMGMGQFPRRPLMG